MLFENLNDIPRSERAFEDDYDQTMTLIKNNFHYTTLQIGNMKY